ncbi:MAG: hypothetical protein ACTHYR_09470 [Brachybacterium sp.]
MTLSTRSGTSAPASRTDPPAPPRRPRRTWFPYLILLPAVILEVLIHIIPMVTGFWMSFVELTKFFIRRWTEAPSRAWRTTGSPSTSTPRSGRSC